MHKVHKAKWEIIVYLGKSIEQGLNSLVPFPFRHRLGIRYFEESRRDFRQPFGLDGRHITTVFLGR